MLTSIKSAGVALEVNLRISQERKHARDPLWFETKGRDPNQGYQSPHEKDLCPSSIKNTLLLFLLVIASFQEC